MQSAAADNVEAQVLRPCSYCGADVPEGDLVALRQSASCPRCKPFTLQLIKEGSLLPGHQEYAGFWPRGGARLVDGLVRAILGTLLITPVQNLVAAGGTSFPRMATALLVTQVLGMALSVLYEAGFVALYQATPGKMLLGLKVTTADGRPLGWGRAIGRYFAVVLSWFTAGIGFLVAAFDEQRRAMHDHLCGTRVVRAL